MLIFGSPRKFHFVENQICLNGGMADLSNVIFLRGSRLDPYYFHVITLTSKERKKEEKKKGNEIFPRHRRGNTACADHFCLHISFSETCNLYATSLEKHSCEIYPAIFRRDFASHHECKLSSRHFINVDIDRLDFWIRPRIMDRAD